MATQCQICNTNMGVFGSLITFDFGYGINVGVCAECNRKLLDILSSRNNIEFRKNKVNLNYRISENISTNIKQVIDSFCLGIEDNIQTKAKKIKKICPICSTLSMNNEKFCKGCGYNFNNIKQYSYQEMAEVVNSRKTKLEDNSVYEYESVIVYDNKDGTADIATINSVLSEYSLNGWRLHTIYANELGRTSTGFSFLGFLNTTNATISQQIMIFERCIKKQPD